MEKTVSILGVADEYWSRETNQMEDGWRLLANGWGTPITQNDPPTLQDVRVAIAEYHSVLAHLLIIEKELSIRTI